jgi:hypothetical protein
MLASPNSSTSIDFFFDCSTWMTFCATRSAVLATGVTDTLTGSRNSSAASAPISCGMVAEKNMLCRFMESLEMIWRSGLMKPRSIIWSASSSTRISVWLRSMLRSFMWSMRRPGVATTTSTPRCKASACGRWPTPPNTVITEKPVWRP